MLKLNSYEATKGKKVEDVKMVEIWKGNHTNVSVLFQHVLCYFSKSSVQ